MHVFFGLEPWATGFGNQKATITAIITHIAMKGREGREAVEGNGSGWLIFKPTPPNKFRCDP